MPINDLYHTWNMRIRQLQPMERKTRIQNLTWLIVGIHQSRSVCLSRIAGKIPGKAKLLSMVQRLSRFLANPSVNVRDWYEPIARSWLEMQARHLQQVRLIVDGTKVGFAHQLLIVSLAYRKHCILRQVITKNNLFRQGNRMIINSPTQILKIVRSEEELNCDP